MRNQLLYIFAIASLAGCSDRSQATADSSDDAAVADTGIAVADEARAAGESSCPDDGPVLPGSGICVGRAVNYLNIVEGEEPALPENCHWTVNETAIVDDYLLYRAASCNGKTAKLDFAGGARFASLGLAWSAVANQAMPDMIPVRITGADMDDPRDNILAAATLAMDDPVEAKKCRVRPAGIEGWPADALVVDVSPAEAAKAPQDEPRQACGPFGLDQDNSAYWRIFQGFSWWFQLGQDAYQDIDPRTLTLVTADKTGGWEVLP